MTDKMTFQRNLIGKEDLALGTGVVTQTRGVTEVPITQINAANFPYDDNLTLKDKIDALDTTLYVNGAGIPQYIATPHSPTALNLADVIWIKDVSSVLREVYYFDKLMFKYNPTSGNLVIENAVFAPILASMTAAYQAADTALNAALIAVINGVITNQNQQNADMTIAYQQADTALVASLALGAAATKDVGTDPLDLVQINAAGKLPAIDGSLLTNLPVASAAVGSMVQRTVDESTAVTIYTNYVNRNGSAPAITAGTELFARSFTPKASGNKLVIRFRGDAHVNHDKIGACAMLFINGNFVRGAWVRGPAGLNFVYPMALVLEYEFTAPSGAAIDIRLRVGPMDYADGSMRFNDSSFGATGKNVTMVIEEVKA